MTAAPPSRSVFRIISEQPSARFLGLSVAERNARVARRAIGELSTTAGNLSTTEDTDRQTDRPTFELTDVRASGHQPGFQPAATTYVFFEDRLVIKSSCR